MKKLISWILRYGGGICIFLYGVVPVIIKTNPWILEKIVFLNMVYWPRDAHVTEPERYGIEGCHSFYLKVADDATIGVWHILPSNLRSKDILPDQYENHLQKGNQIFIYLHGNSNTRAQTQRVALMKQLSGMDFHVVAIDYRGYADSTGTPTEDGVVADAYYTYKWIQKRKGNSPVFIWGHSLGSAVASKLGKQLSDNGEEPTGIILEAPFSNMKDGVASHPFAFAYRALPWFDWLFYDSLEEAGVYFKSDEHLKSVSVPILLLHAKDDFVIPYSHSEKIYKEVSKNKEPKSLKLVLFEEERGYGHKYIHRAPELPDILREFMNTCTTGRKRS